MSPKKSSRPTGPRPVVAPEASAPAPVTPVRRRASAAKPASKPGQTEAKPTTAAGHASPVPERAPKSASPRPSARPAARASVRATPAPKAARRAPTPAPARRQPTRSADVTAGVDSGATGDAAIVTPVVVTESTTATITLGDPAADAQIIEISHEEIRVRAYFLSLERGGRGSDLDIWLEAERQLRADRARSTTGD